MTARPALLVTLTLPERIEPGHVRFARDLARSAALYAAEVERTWRGLPPLPRVPALTPWPRPVTQPPAGACHPSAMEGHPR